ncbi:MAG: biotin-dependent carboxyltransferase family protein [Desulfotignum sp.]|nr:biotin-dependent carboxyltransferase family protein [Desulfotignum sp.]MCF8088399.1 biotin-dependent carboxyltransferase family protein [Desulfotignum sp.]MCF8137085.1 biotin-dependent carboxyltransferase family protein [Desulfotignum sp.]
MQAFEVVSPGGFTTVQDKGRFGFQQMGVPICGVLDTFAADMANRLVGNDDSLAVLEITVTGPSLRFFAPLEIAVTGAEMDMTLNGRPMAQWRSMRVGPDDVLTLSQVRSGCRAYLAVSGGIDVPRVMGSFSTYVGGGLGGYQGRPLKIGDILDAREVPLLTRDLAMPENMIPEYPSHVVLRVVPGPQNDYFDPKMTALFTSQYMVTPKADRMGYRLMGEKIPIRPGMPKSIVSEPSMPGGIQIPADEQPIILLVEQTVGGYAKIATVISTDIPKLAQTTPGDTLSFEGIDLAAAHRIYHEARRKQADIRLD